LAEHIGHLDGTALVVEDTDADRESVSRMLQSVGMTVAQASNGRAALKWLEDHSPPAVMLLDIMMPELDGFAVLEAVRKDERLRNLPVIVLTAKDLSSAELEYLRGRGGLVVSKGPAARETVLGALRRQTPSDGEMRV
jgi:CheY-like chemotaxis protein